MYIILVSYEYMLNFLQLTVCKGTKEMDENHDMWADDDYEHPSDLDWCRDEEEFQEGYYWTCCKVTGEKKGCAVRDHLVRSSKVAR